MTRNVALNAALAIVVAGRTAAADPGPLEADPLIDGAVIAGSTVGALAMRWIKINDAPAAWNHELFGALDDRIKLHYSPRMRALSDVGLVASVALPAALAIGTEWDRAAGDRALVFGESIGATLLLTSITKTLIARPRPYTYSNDPEAKAHAKHRGRDSRRSFFSGHAATAFAALAAGGALYAGREPDKSNRALAWGAGAAIAGATVNWRLRAGEHFYSDIIVGALVGVAAGTIVPAIHTGGVYRPSGAEWAALAGGLVLGGLVSQVVPVANAKERRIDEDPSTLSGKVHAELTPLVLPSGGGGLGLVGTF
jgi:hypothetical protein